MRKPGKKGVVLFRFSYADDVVFQLNNQYPFILKNPLLTSAERVTAKLNRIDGHIPSLATFVQVGGQRVVVADKHFRLVKMCHLFSEYFQWSKLVFFNVRPKLQGRE